MHMLANLEERFKNMKGFFIKAHPASSCYDSEYTSISFYDSDLRLRIRINHGTAFIEVRNFNAFSKGTFMYKRVLRRLIMIIISELRHENVGLVLCDSPVFKMTPLSKMPLISLWDERLSPKKDEYVCFKELEIGYIANLISYAAKYIQFFTSLEKIDKTVHFVIHKLLTNRSDSYYYQGHQGMIKINISPLGGHIEDTKYGKYEFSGQDDFEIQLKNMFDRISRDRRLKNLFDSPRKHFDEFSSKQRLQESVREKIHSLLLLYIDNEKIEEMMVDAVKEPIMSFNAFHLFQIKQFVFLEKDDQIYCFLASQKQEAFTKMKALAFSDFQESFNQAFDSHEVYFKEMVAKLKLA